MKTFFTVMWRVIFVLTVGDACSALAQGRGDFPPGPDRPPPPGGPWREGPPDLDGPPPFGPGDFRPGGPRGGPGGMMRQKIKLVEQFDKDGDKRLNAEERKAAREFVRQQNLNRGPRGGPGERRGGRRPRDENENPPEPGPKVAFSDAKSFPDAPLYDGGTLRTLFIEFEDADWEKELAEFKNTDVEVPATLIVDGQSYPDVGIHFRGASSFMMVGEGHKRSLNLSLDFVHPDQRLRGYRTLNLLNSHDDPSFLRAVLYCQIARDYLPAPHANFMRVVINGEYWGVYANVEQFNKDFIKEWFGTTKGARWKVPGSPNGRGSLAYLGDDPAPYRRIYEIKSQEDPASWAALIQLCKVLDKTPADQLEKMLQPLLDIDGALKFLALENALINNDGYWVRSSDYSLYQDKEGRFHLLPQDVNETFLTPGGPGPGDGPGPDDRRGRDFVPGRPGVAAPSDGGAPGSGPRFNRGPRIKGVELDPLIAANDASKPLLSKLLAVPPLRDRYLGYVRDIAEKWLDWKKLGPQAQHYHSLIADAVKADTRKLYSTEAFLKGLTEVSPEEGADGPPGTGRRTISLKSFAERRRAFLLNHPEVKKSVAAATR